MLHQYVRYGLFALVLSSSSCTGLGGPVPPPNYAPYSDTLPCVNRIGRCFDATIGDLPVTAITDKVLYDQIFQLCQEVNKRIGDEVYWQVLEPVDGNRVLEVSVSSNDLGLKEIGAPKEAADLTIYPLDGQSLQSEEELVESSNVFINKQPVVTKQNTLTQDSLPPGRYIIALRYTSQKNWDRKHVFVTVK